MVKSIEKLGFFHISNFIYFLNLLSNAQFGFRPRISCTSQLIHLFHTWAKSFDERKSTDVIFLDFEKAFDSVPHNRLLVKLKNYGIKGQLLWLSDFLSRMLQRVTIEGSQSDWARVSSGVPQGSILGPFLFLLYVNDIPENLSCPQKCDCTKITYLFHVPTSLMIICSTKYQLITISILESLYLRTCRGNPMSCILLLKPIEYWAYSNVPLGNAQRLLISDTCHWFEQYSNMLVLCAILIKCICRISLKEFNIMHQDGSVEKISHMKSESKSRIDPPYWTNENTLALYNFLSSLKVNPY